MNEHTHMYIYIYIYIYYTLSIHIHTYVFIHTLPEASTWSNGNCFRALTLLAATHCEQQKLEGPVCDIILYQIIVYRIV